MVGGARDADRARAERSEQARDRFEDLPLGGQEDGLVSLGEAARLALELGQARVVPQRGPPAPRERGPDLEIPDVRGRECPRGSPDGERLVAGVGFAHGGVADHEVPPDGLDLLGVEPVGRGLCQIEVVIARAACVVQQLVHEHGRQVDGGRDLSVHQLHEQIAVSAERVQARPRHHRPAGRRGVAVVRLMKVPQQCDAWGQPGVAPVRSRSMP